MRLMLEIVILLEVNKMYFLAVDVWKNSEEFYYFNISLYFQTEGISYGITFIKKQDELTLRFLQQKLIYFLISHLLIANRWELEHVWHKKRSLWMTQNILFEYLYHSSLVWFLSPEWGRRLRPHLIRLSRPPLSFPQVPLSPPVPVRKFENLTKPHQMTSKL